MESTLIFSSQLLQLIYKKANQRSHCRTPCQGTSHFNCLLSHLPISKIFNRLRMSFSLTEGGHRSRQIFVQSFRGLASSRVVRFAGGQAHFHRFVSHEKNYSS